MEKIRIALIDDHSIVRDGIKALISDEKDIEICGEYGSANEFLNEMKTIPEIVLLDIAMPGMSGLELCETLYEKHPDIKIMILSMYTEEDFINKAIKYGVKAYLPKNTSKKEIIKNKEDRKFYEKAEEAFKVITYRHQVDLLEKLIPAVIMSYVGKS